jgi:hypothetical protein
MARGPDDLVLRWTSRLLAEDGVFAGVQRALRTSLDARKAVDRNVGRVLAGLNLPSHQDVERLFDHIQQLESEIGAVNRRLAALAERIERQSAPHHCSPQKPDGKTGE